MTQFTITFQNEVLSPGRKRGDDIHSPGELQCPPSSISHLSRSINKACFVRSMNENSFLLCILLKLESYGLLPLMMFTGFQRPHVQIWLTSHPPNSPSLMLTSQDIQPVWSFLSWRIFMGNAAVGQEWVTCSKLAKTDAINWFLFVNRTQTQTCMYKA